MKKSIIALTALCACAAQAVSIYGPRLAYSPTYDESTAYEDTYAYAPATVYYNGVFHQFYCSTGGPSDKFFVHPDDVKNGIRNGNNNNGFTKSWDHVRYRSSKNGYMWSPAKVVMTQTHFSSSKKENCACDPAIVMGTDGYWYLYYAGNIDNYNTVVYVSRSKTISGPFLRLTERNTWEQWPNDPKPILKKWTGNKATNASIYGVGQLAVVRRGNNYHFWFVDNTKTTSGKLSYMYATSTSPTSIPESSWRKISIDGKTEHPIIDFGDVRWNPSKSQYEMWLPSKYCNEDTYFYKYSSKNGYTWTKTSDTFGGPYNFVNNLGVSGDEVGWIKNNRYIISFAGPTKGLHKKITDFPEKNSQGQVRPNRSMPWSMWQIVVDGYQRSTQNIPFGMTFAPDGSKNLEFISGDYDGDGVTDIVAVDRKTSKWYVRSSLTGAYGTTLIPWGWKWEGMQSYHTIVTADFDGDGKTDPALVDVSNGTWYIISSKTGAFMRSPTDNNEIIWGWKWPGMGSQHVVLPGDYDGDGLADRAIVDKTNGNLYVLSSRTGAFFKTAAGQEIWGWKFPNWTSNKAEMLLGDYDGDGATDFAAVNRSSGKWYFYSSRTGKAMKNVYDGNTSDWWNWTWPGMGSQHQVVFGDYDGDGVTDRAIVDKNNGLWYILSSQTGGFLKTSSGDQIWGWTFDKWAGSNSKILVGDYDGDGVTDRAFVDVSKNKVYIYSSRNGTKGISNQLINHVYPFATNAVMLKKHDEVKYNEKETIAAKSATITVDGLNLFIQNASVGDKILVVDVRGKEILRSTMEGNSQNLHVPFAGRYILRIGTKSMLIDVK